MYDLKDKVSGYQELKLILADMKKSSGKIIEIKCEILFKVFYELKNLKYQKNVLIDEVNKLKDEVNSLKHVTVNSQTKEFDQDIQSFLLILDVLKELKSRGAWIEYKNKTVHTKEYYRIVKETMDMIIEEKAAGKIDPKKVLDTMANLGILRKQADKVISSASVEGVPKRIYMVRIDSVDYL